MQSFKHLNINSTFFKDIVKVIAKYDWDVEGGGRLIGWNVSKCNGGIIWISNKETKETNGNH